MLQGLTSMRVKPVVAGAASFVPGLYERFGRTRTGGTDIATYCYGVWLKHLTLWWANGIRRIPQNLVELGPGDSLGIGLAGLLSGVHRYTAVDVVKAASTERTLAIFDELVTLFRQQAPRPRRGWPDFDAHLDENLFPSHILPEEHLDACLSDERIAAIRQSIREESDEGPVRYVTPWEVDALPAESADCVMSHSVLEHVTDHEMVYRAMAHWLKPGGWTSHQIDFSSHNLGRQWNSHWACSDALWTLIQGKRPFLLNRLPSSVHERALSNQGFKVVAFERCQSEQGIRRDQLAPHFRNMPDEDFNCLSAYVLAVKSNE
ncbi:MAG: class I SAM-dependent methyltransferase [Proteobacteria bacterium]|nr:class I SAM-dependent methyltransferase [Pseudomonadota bacterium]